MLEKPNLSDETIIARLRDDYAIAAASLEFLPIGNDSNAWVYRVQGEQSESWFLKVRRSIAQRALLVPHYLSESGISQIVTPLLNTSGKLSSSTGEYALIVYPYVAGEIAFHYGMTDAQWIEFGVILRQIHKTPVHPDLRDVVPHETFIPPALAMITRLDTAIQQGTFTESLQASLAAYWQEQRPLILRLLERVQALSAELKSRSAAYVICHADIHTFNVLVDAVGGLWIVDWDEAILAPPERDLMFVRGAIGGAPVYEHEETLFWRGYGTHEIHAPTLAYYRYDWALQEIADYGRRVFFMPELGETSREYALQMFYKMFEPGDVVEAAFASDQ